MINNKKKIKNQPSTRRIVLWDDTYVALEKLASMKNTTVAKISNVALVEYVNRELEKAGIIDMTGMQQRSLKKISDISNESDDSDS